MLAPNAFYIPSDNQAALDVLFQVNSFKHSKLIYLIKSRVSMKKYLHDHKQPSYHILRRYLPHFQVELSQQNVCTLISPQKSRAVLMDLFPVLTACFNQSLSYLAYDIGHKIIFSLIQDKRPRLSRSGCEGQKIIWQVAMAELETQIFDFQFSKTSLTEALYSKDHFSNSIFTYLQLISLLIQRPFLSGKKILFVKQKL